MTTSNSSLPTCDTCERILAEGLEEWDDSQDLLCFGPSDPNCRPPEKIETQLKNIGAQISGSAEARNHVEFDKLGVHIDGLFGAMSELSKKYPLGTEQNPITQNEPNEDRRYKFCRCSKCKTVQKCIPSSDFYICPDGSLRCEDCFRTTI